MSQVIIGTFIMMGMAFVIGFVVAYLIKLISVLLDYFEHFSLPDSRAIRKRFHSIRKIRKENFKRILVAAQLDAKNELLDHFYPCQTEKDEKNTNQDQQDNALTRYYYERH